MLVHMNENLFHEDSEGNEREFDFVVFYSNRIIDD